MCDRIPECIESAIVSRHSAAEQERHLSRRARDTQPKKEAGISYPCHTNITANKPLLICSLHINPSPSDPEKRLIAGARRLRRLLVSIQLLFLSFFLLPLFFLPLLVLLFYVTDQTPPLAVE